MKYRGFSALTTEVDYILLTEAFMVIPFSRYRFVLFLELATTRKSTRH